jgi:rare lipoprotein A
LQKYCKYFWAVSKTWILGFREINIKLPLYYSNIPYRTKTYPMRNFLILILVLPVFALQTNAQATSGLASYYAPGFHGNPTSTGEKYNHQALTCANRDFPVGTILRVTRVDDGRWVNVRVNDCGPHRAGRVVDLSGAAAERIGLIRDGLTQVNLSVVTMGTGRTPCGKSYQAVTANSTPISYENTGSTPAKAQPPVSPSPQLEGQGTFRAEALKPIESGFGVQVGSYRYPENAAKVVADLEAKGFTKVLIRLQGNVHQVVLGPFDTRGAAAVYRDNLWRNYKQRGFVTAIQN